MNNRKIEASSRRLPRSHWKAGVSLAALICAAMSASSAMAASNIESGSTYLASNLGNSVNPDFKGGTLTLDSSTTLSTAFAVEDYVNNTMDIDGHAVTLSGVLSGAGPMTFVDNIGGGSVTLTGANSYTGATTINNGATLLLSGTGTLSTSSGLVNAGTFDISQTTAGTSITTLSGSGTVNLGAQTLTMTAAAGTFTGAITGTGGLVITSGTEILSGANTYTGGTTITAGLLQIGNGGTTGSIAGNISNAGAVSFVRTDALSYDGVISGTGSLTQGGTGTTTITGINTYTGATNINAGTLALSGNGSIAASSSISDIGTFDISATSGTSIKSISGTGAINLGAQTLTITAGSGTFAGTITGSGGITLTGGSILLAGDNNYTGATTIQGGTLKLGSPTIGFNVTDNSTLAFISGDAIAVTGQVSGTGAVQQIGSGITTISTAQSYTGATTISAGTLALSGSGNIAASSSVTDNAIFDISATTGGASIISLSGTGSVALGGEVLSLTNAAGSFSGVISGTGGVTLTGGIQTLSGINTYTGPTTIAAGTLVLAGPTSIATSSVMDNGVLDISSVSNAGIATSASIVSLGGSGTVLLGAKTLILTNAGDSFSGTLNGTGGLTINGGNETLTAANTYTGDTTIASGTLTLSGAGNLAATSRVVNNGIFDVSATTGGSVVTLASLSGSGTVKLGARSVDLISGGDNFSGTIQGAGSVTISGGTQILSGANTYTGGTVISGGTLQIGAGGAGGSILGDVLDNSVLAFNRSDTAVFSGAISGAGRVNQIGSGVTVLTGANSYNGGTTISAGTLQIGNGGTSGSINGDVTDNGTLAFARSDTNAFGGTISGTGGVTFISGTTLLTAVNSYSGATLIDSVATLGLSGSGSIANSAVTDNGVFDLSAATSAPKIASLAGSGSAILGAQSLTITNGSGNFSGVLSGSGGVSVTGGTQTLSGVNTYTGATSVLNGTLAVNGSIATSSGVTVGSAGILSGTGTVSTTTVASGGTIAPSGGTLSVNGNATFSSGSVFLINASATAASKLDVSGIATLAGTLNVTSTDGTWLLGQKQTVLTADGGVTGTFTLGTTQSSSGAQFKNTLSYDANDVYLEVDLAKLSTALPTTASTNETNAIGGIDAAITAGDTLPSQYQGLANVSSTVLATDAQQLAGEIGANVPQAGNALFAPFIDAIFDHLDDTKSRTAPPKNGAWLSGFTGNAINGGDNATGSQKLDSSLSGFAGGADWMLSPRFSLGAAVSSGSTSFHLSDALGTGSANAVQFGVYGLTRFSSRLYGAFVAGVALDNVTTHRTVTVSGTDTLDAKFNGIGYGGRYELGAMLGWITPYLALQDTLFQTPNYSETASAGAATYALHYDFHSNNSATLELGVRQQGDIPLNRNWTLRLSDRLAWAHGLSDTHSADAAFVALPDSDFTSYGALMAQDTARISLGAGLRNRAGLGLDLHFEGNASAHTQSYTGIAGLNYTW